MTQSPHTGSAASPARLRKLLRFTWGVTLGGTLLVQAADLAPVAPLGLRVARGFRVTRFADADLAPDIWAMTVDARGRVVVTGPGYIRTLLDVNGDGRADRAVEFARTETGGQGLCFDGPVLYFVGDGGLWRFTDENGDGLADGPPDRLLPLSPSEHGGHAVRMGPDGALYLLKGNAVEFADAHTSHPASPLAQAEGGALLRLPPDGGGCETIAHGFRNAYDFDFNSFGDLFTCDQDDESVFPLPWSVPARVFHVAQGGHHGWLAQGRSRSRACPEGAVDTVEPLAALGRAAPTGVAAYRHYQFPRYFQAGLFVCDWTFGRIHFLRLEPDGASFAAHPEVFLEAMGTEGFAPTDLVVSPDGALLVSTGGRQTRGSVLRIDDPTAGPTALFTEAWWRNALTPIDVVLDAPQPLEAWSRVHWEPLARQMGPAPFAALAVDQTSSPEARVRAIEVLTTMPGGLPPAVAAGAARTLSPRVRARVAWSLGRVPIAGFIPMLTALASDPEPMVRQAALQALLDRRPNLDEPSVRRAIDPNLAHPDPRLRQAAARLAMHFSADAWQGFWAASIRAAPPARLTAILALLWREPPQVVHHVAAEAAWAVLNQSRLPEHRLEALRLIVLALGGYRLANPSAEVFVAYEPAISLLGHDALVSKLRRSVGLIFPSGHAAVDREAARLLAMLEADEPALSEKLLARVHDRSAPSDDFHTLAVLARVRSPLSTNATSRLTQALLGLDRKLGRTTPRARPVWNVRLTELTQRLLQRDPRLAEALLHQPGFATAGNLPLAQALPRPLQLRAAKLLLAAVTRDPQFPWSQELIDVLALLPAQQVRPLWRRQWSNAAWGDALLLQLAEAPEAIDRERFVAGLASPNPRLAQSAAEALLQLAPDAKRQVLLAAMQLLRRLLAVPEAKAARADALALVNHEAAQNFLVAERGPDRASLEQEYGPVFNWFRHSFPALARQLDPEAAGLTPKALALLASAPWSQGNAQRGAARFVEWRCHGCHAPPNALGPDLAGVAGRLSLTNVILAIVNPSFAMAPAHRATQFEMRDRTSHAGQVVFESAERVLLRTGATSSARLAVDDIVARRPSPRSLMPEGLLEGVRVADVADLYAFLRALKGPVP